MGGNMIRFDKVSKTFETTAGEVHALSEIDLNIEKGCIFGVIGSSGAGKSTLVRCMNLLERPTSGDVYFDDVNLTKLPMAELRQMRRKISMIFQQFNLLEQRDALGNVIYPLEISGVSKKEAKEKGWDTAFYLLTPNYNDIDLSVYKSGCFYKKIYYKQVYDFCVKQKEYKEDIYFRDFVNALYPHTKDISDDLYEDMKHLFLQRIKGRSRKS